MSGQKSPAAARRSIGRSAVCWRLRRPSCWHRSRRRPAGIRRRRRDHRGVGRQRRRHRPAGPQGRRRLSGRRGLRPELRGRQDLLHPGHRRPHHAGRDPGEVRVARRTRRQRPGLSHHRRGRRAAPDSRNTTFSAADKPGHLLDAGHRRAGRAWADQRRVGQARRLGGTCSACRPRTRSTAVTSSLRSSPAASCRTTPATRRSPPCRPSSPGSWPA